MFNFMNPPQAAALSDALAPVLIAAALLPACFAAMPAHGQERPTIAIDSATAIVAEDKGRTELKAVLSKPAAVESSVRYIAVDGTAVSGTDFHFADSRLKFPPGATEATMLLFLSRDGINTPDKQFTVRFFDPVGIAASADGIVTMRDVDEVTLSIAGGDAITEGDGSRAEFTISADRASTVALTVALSVAETGMYLIRPPGETSLILPAGARSAVFVAPEVHDDTTDEGDGGITVELLPSAAAAESLYGYHLPAPAAARAQVAVRDDDSVSGILFSTPRSAVTEGEHSHLVYFLALDNASAKTVEVDYRTRDGTAIAGQDYRALSGTHTFLPTQLGLLQVAVPIIDDELHEAGDGDGEEQFALVFSNPRNAIFRDRRHGIGAGPVSITVAIRDNDEPLPELSIGVERSPITEGETAIFTIRSSAALASKLTVAMDARSGAAGTFLADTPPATVLLSAGNTVAKYLFRTEDDMEYEPHGDIVVAIGASAAYSISPQAARATVRVLNDDPRKIVPVVTLKALSPPAVAEGAATELAFAITSVPAAPENLTIKLALSETGDMLADASSLSAVIPAGASRVEHRWRIVDDQVDEPASMVTAQLARVPLPAAGAVSAAGALPAGGALPAADASSASGARYIIGDSASAAIRVADNDPLVRLSGPAAALEGDTLMYTVSADSPPYMPIQLNVLWSETNALLPAARPESVTLPADALRARFSVELLDTDVIDKGRRLRGHVTTRIKAAAAEGAQAPSAYRLEHAETTLQVDEDETNWVWVQPRAGAAITEGEKAQFALFSSINRPDRDIMVRIAIAESGGEFTPKALPTEVLIPKNAQQALVIIETIDDGRDEPDGNITLSILPGDGYRPIVAQTPARARSAAIAIRDNDAAPKGVPELSFSSLVRLADAGCLQEGEVIIYRVSARYSGGDIPAALPVNVSITERGGEFLAGDQPARITLANGARPGSSGGGGATIARLFEISSTDDEVDEMDGIVTVRGLGGEGYRVSDSANTLVYRFCDNDTPRLSINPEADPVPEGGTARFKVSADLSPHRNLEVPMTLDYDGGFTGRVLRADTLRLAQGRTTATISFATVDDDVREADGSLRLTLEEGDGWNLANAESVIRIQDNDEGGDEWDGGNDRDDGDDGNDGGDDGRDDGDNGDNGDDGDDGSDDGDNGDDGSDDNDGGDDIGDDGNDGEDGGDDRDDGNNGGDDGNDGDNGNDGDDRDGGNDDGDNGNDGGDDGDDGDNGGEDPIRPPEVVIAPIAETINEGADAMFLIRAAPAPAAALSIAINAADSGRLAAAPLPQSIALPAGRAAATLVIPTEDDERYDGDNGNIAVAIIASETFTLPAASAATVFVTDNDPPPVADLIAPPAPLSPATDGAAAEAMPFTVRLSAISDRAAAVLCSTGGGTALAETDYQPMENQLLRIPAGETTATMAVAMLRSPAEMGGKTLTMKLSEPEGATLGIAAATALIAPAPLASGEPPVDEQAAAARIAEQANAAVLPHAAIAIADEGARTIKERIRAGFERERQGGLTVQGGGISDYLAQQARRESGLDFREGAFAMAAGEGAGAAEAAAEAAPADSFNGLLNGIAVWGQGYYRELSAQKGADDVQGDLSGAFIGIDASPVNGMLAGLSLNHSKTKLDFTSGGLTGTHAITAAGIRPYIGWQISSDARMWASFGFERGEFEIAAESAGGDAAMQQAAAALQQEAAAQQQETPALPLQKAATAVDGDLRMQSFALGGFGPLYGRERADETLSLGITGDSLLARVSATGPGAVTASAGRQRLGFELDYRRRFRSSPGANSSGTSSAAGSGGARDASVFGSANGANSGQVPSYPPNPTDGDFGSQVELAFRQDFGDGITGAALELSGGLNYRMPFLGLRFNFNTRALLAHQGSIDEWGIAGGIAWTAADDGRGLSIAFNPYWGGAAERDLQFWELGIAGGYLSGYNLDDRNLGGRYPLELNYGIAVPGGGLLKLFVKGEAGGGRDLRLGASYSLGGDFRAGYEAVFGPAQAELPALRYHGAAPLFPASGNPASPFSASFGAPMDALAVPGASQIDHAVYIHYEKRFGNP